MSGFFIHGEQMLFGSVCSGIEAASVAFYPLGWRAAWLSEIEPFPSAVLAHHYPSVPNLGDMTRLPAAVLTGEAAAPDVLCGGTPCQAFSVAGMREGLNDPRGQLTIKFVELADAIDHVRTRAGKPECITLWENVPGVLSDRGNAFGCFLGALAGEDCELQPPGGKWKDAGCVYGPKRTIAWRVLDAQYFGLAQRRRRVFVVASARNDFDPCAVLFESDSLRRDTAPSREARQVAPSIPSRGTAGGGLGTDFDCDGGLIAKTLCAGGHSNNPLDETLVTVHTLRGEGFDASEDGTWRGTPLVPMAADGVRYAYYSHDYANDRITDVTGINPALTSRNTASGNLNVAVPIAFNPTQDPISSPHVAYTTKLHNTGSNNAGKIFEERTTCLDANSPPPALLTATQVRRLTPVECERLMGFPDGYTAIPWRKKPASECPDGPRYKALGNSWAVPVAAWIAQRIHRQIAT